MHTIKPTRERLLELLDYDPATGVLRWREKLDCLGRRQSSSGKIAGTKKPGEIQIHVDSKLYRAHQIIWVMQTGFWVPRIDHDDGDPWNNSWLNLREATSSQNNSNRHTVSGEVPFRGVYYLKRHKAYAAQIKKDKKWKWLGMHTTAEGAARAYDKAALELHGEFSVTNVYLGLLK